MKKSLFKFALTTSIAALGVTCLASCNLFKKKKENSTTELNIVCLNLGYGREWIDDLVSVWEAENPGYKVNLTADANANAVIQKNLYSKDNVDDLYIANSKSWKTYAARGLLLELDDMLNEQVDGVKIVDKVNDEYKKSIYYNNHTYRLPWTSGVPGIYYNAKLFEKNGWSVPTTTTDLLTLCNKIRTDEVGVIVNGKESSDYVKPFVFTGENTDYFDYAVYTWWAQLAGKDAVDNYLKYESAATFSDSNPAFKALGKALQEWKNIFGDKENYVKGSDGWSNHLAQQSFYNGYAAMMINCDWLYNEMLKYTDNNQFRSGFELKIMNTPVATGAVDTHISYIVGEDQYYAIPKSTIKADLAKSFIKLMISDRGIKTFAEKAHGTLAYKSTAPYSTSDIYTNSLISYLGNATKRFTNWSESPLFLNNVIDIWTTNDLAPYTRFIDGTKTDVNDYMNEISNNARDKWNTWLTQASANSSN